MEFKVPKIGDVREIDGRKVILSKMTNKAPQAAHIVVTTLHGHYLIGRIYEG